MTLIFHGVHRMHPVLNGVHAKTQRGARQNRTGCTPRPSGVHSVHPIHPLTDITALLNDRLIQLSVTDKTGMESDEFELRIDDRDGLVTLPRKGVGIEIYLGYQETSLVRLGRYVVG